MARIRRLDIQHFRSIREMAWCPAPGINGLIGAGDAGKSTILDAIDLCLGARRSIAVADTDFTNLDVLTPICITVTLGELAAPLKNIDAYGDFLRAFHPVSGQLEDEPKAGWETVLSLRVTVGADLEPVWSLYSPAAKVVGVERNLRWNDRVSVAPARLGPYTGSHLGWAKGSVLNRLSGDPVHLGPALASAARQARTSFGSLTSEPLKEALDQVATVAAQLGVPVGSAVQALLDAHEVSMGDGAVALHDAAGVPLRSLGTGSSRLLVAGLQRAAATTGSGIVLVDEVETGLEPHRLQRLLMSLGAKDATPPLQIFMTTHSPVAVRELDGGQLWAIRNYGTHHAPCWVGQFEDARAVARATPEAMLAPKVILCEGESEVGLVRGLDVYWTGQSGRSFLAAGTSVVSFGGSYPEKGFERGLALQNLGYRTVVVVDNDKPIASTAINAHTKAGGMYLTWETGRSTEEELFVELGDAAVNQLLQRALATYSEQSINDQLVSASKGARTLAVIQADAKIAGYAPADRHLLGQVAHKNKWYKAQAHSEFEFIATEIVGPTWDYASHAFRARMDWLKGWAHGP